MKFTVDFSTSFFSEKRLKTDNTFKKIETERNLFDDDMIFNEYAEAECWFERNPIVVIEQVEYQTRPESYKLGSPSISIRPHRVTKPEKHFVTKDELRELLISGDDDHYNMLVVDFNGYPKLIQRPSRGYAVRLEGFGARGGYVGRRSGLSHLNHTYKILLEAWLLHLTSDKSIYRDYLSGEYTEEVLISKIRECIDSFD